MAQRYWTPTRPPAAEVTSTLGDRRRCSRFRWPATAKPAERHLAAARPGLIWKSTFSVNGYAHRVALDLAARPCSTWPANTWTSQARRRAAIMAVRGLRTVHADGCRLLACTDPGRHGPGQARSLPIEVAWPADGMLRDPMQAAFIAHDAFQCGYCTPGQIGVRRRLRPGRPRQDRQRHPRTWRVATSVAAPPIPRSSPPSVGRVRAWKALDAVVPLRTRRRPRPGAQPRRRLGRQPPPRRRYDLHVDSMKLDVMRPATVVDINALARDHAFAVQFSPASPAPR